MEGFEPVFVSYHQFQVITGDDISEYLDLDTVHDDLVHVTGTGLLNGDGRAAYRMGRGARPGAVAPARPR